MNLSITDISYAPFLDIFYGLIIFLNILFISSKFQYKLVDFDKKLNLIFNINYLIILISLVFFFISLIGFDYFLLSKFLKILNLILFFYFIFIFLKNSNQLIKKIKIKKFYSPIFIFIICYFLLSLSPVSDADSLDYHLGIPLDIINNEKLIPRKDWTHFYIFGLGEFFILFGILTGTTILGQIVNFYSLISLLYLMITNLKSNKINDQIYLLLYFLSAPIFLWLVYSSKTYLFPCLLIALIFRYLFTIKRINNIILITLAIYLAYILACKVSFLYEIIIIFCLFIYKKISQIKLNQFIYIFFFSGLIILFPIYYTKFIFFSDIIPPFFENLKTNPDLKMLIFKETLIKDLQDFSKFHYAKIFFLPIILIVSLKVNFFSALLGVGFLGFYLCFVKKKILFRFIKKPEFLFVILILLTLFFSKNLQPRYYLSAYIIFGFLLCDLHKIYYKKMFYKCFINLIKFQAYSVLIILIISSLIFFSGRINLKYEQKIMSLISYNYNVTTWINNNIQNDKIITSDFIRSHSLIKNKFISRKEIFFNRNRNINEYKKDLTKYNIDNVILLEPLTPELNQLLIECGKQNYVKKIFLHERRNLYNLFFKKSYKKFIIFENKCKN